MFTTLPPCKHGFFIQCGKFGMTLALLFSFPSLSNVFLYLNENAATCFFDVENGFDLQLSSKYKIGLQKIFLKIATWRKMRWNVDRSDSSIHHSLKRLITTNQIIQEKSNSPNCIFCTLILPSTNKFRRSICTSALKKEVPLSNKGRIGQTGLLNERNAH